MKRGLVTLLALSVCAGCAATHQRSFASRFIRDGIPTVDLGGPRLAGAAEKVERPDLTISSVSRVSSGTAVEAVDPKLRRALASVTVAPTVQHHMDVAREYRRLYLFDDAHEYLTKALTLHGADAAVFESLARLWRDWGHPDLGLADAYRAVYYAPESPAARNTLGTLLYRLGNVSEAEAQFTAAASLDPKAWYAFANLCHVSMKQGRTREAIAQCNKAKVLRAESPQDARQGSRK